MSEPSANSPQPSLGPFVIAALSTVLASGLWIALQAGLQLTLVTSLAVLIPVMSFSTILIAWSMGWIFVAYGRHKRTTRWVGGTWIMISLTILELLWLTHLADLAGRVQ